MALITAIMLFSIMLTMLKEYNLQRRRIYNTRIELKRLLKERWDKNDSA